MSKTKRIVAPFTNKFGDKINPGDTVYAITVCTKRTNIEKVEYVGYIERQGWNYRTSKHEIVPFVQVRRPTTKSYYVYEGTDTLVNWSTFDRTQKTERKEEQTSIITTLCYNNIIPANSTLDKLAEAV